MIVGTCVGGICFGLLVGFTIGWAQSGREHESDRQDMFQAGRDYERKYGDLDSSYDLF